MSAALEIREGNDGDACGAGSVRTRRPYGSTLGSSMLEGIAVSHE
jgi:hypothetical protein